MQSYDVIIAGGGISGAMAATAAARYGATTLLIERYGFLGGMLTNAGVGPMMSFHAGDKQVIQGLTEELVARLVKKGKSPGHILDPIGYASTITPFDAEAMKHEIEQMVLESGCKLLYYASPISADVRDGRIEKVTVAHKSGTFDLFAKMYIDATGDADVSVLAGVDTILGREQDGVCQPMTMNLKMINVDLDRVKSYVRTHPEEFPYMKNTLHRLDEVDQAAISGFDHTVAKAVQNGDLPKNIQHLLFFETNTKGEVIINTSRLFGYDATDPWSITQAEIEGRQQVRQLDAFFHKYIPGFEDAILLQSGPFVGIRGSRQIKGVYTLTHEDVLKATRFDDVISHCGYPIDIHSPDGEENPVKDDMHLTLGTVYSIPYRCLINDKVANLITVGRSISATFGAQGAIRTTPTIGAIGHAGGLAAAILCNDSSDTRNTDVKKLQNTLLDQNAYLEISKK